MPVHHFEALAQQLINGLESRGCDTGTDLLTPIPELKAAMNGTIFERMGGDELINVKMPPCFRSSVSQDSDL